MANMLADLGYHFVAGPSGDPSDLVLRQLADGATGFEWRGQADYDAVGATPGGTKLPLPTRMTDTTIIDRPPSCAFIRSFATTHACV